MKINPGIEVYCNDLQVSDTIMVNDTEGKPTVASYGLLSWYVIKRGKRVGIRLKNAENQALMEFDGIETFPVDPKWRIQAEFVRYASPRLLLMPSVLGTMDTTWSPGLLQFKINNEEYTLEPSSRPGSNTLFIVFADLTNGVETYGGGRFLYCELADSTAFVDLDFNKAYNPPCAFTEYATCPLPPDQNKIAEEIRAGERAYGSPMH
jgi:uncharacterized protein (DUF1684 family)